MKKILIALFILVFLFGCAKPPMEMPEPEELLPEEEPEEIIPEQIPEAEKGTLKLLVSDQNNLIADFDSVEATFNHVKIYKPKSAVPVEEEFKVVADLTELQGANALKLLELSLDLGSYSKIKLYTSKVKGTLLGNEIEIIIPGDALTVEKFFEIKSGKTTTYVMDLEVVKTGKVTTVTGLEQHKIQPVPLKSGTVPADVTYVKELTAAEMIAKINEKAGKKFDRHVFMTQEKGFTPPEITVELGTKVIWENKDAKKLGILMDGVFDRFIRSGGSYEHTFNRIGSYPYNMKFYLSNQGRVDVVLPEEKIEEEVKAGSPRTLSIKSTGFSPAEVSIKRGTKVTFVNKDTKYHHLVISGEPFTYNLAPDEMHSIVFNELGEFSFHDPYNVKDYAGKVFVIS